ncbi:MAG: protein kinase, partial [Actinomycetota bacterium]|nr:protein kinase [Actinomycetota bacterium]
MRTGHDDPAALLPGYELRERLGAGRRGEVWWAVELATGDDVALRWLPQPADIDDRGRLLAAAEALTGFSHPHQLRVRAVVSAVRDLVLVCDLARGGSLADLLDRRGPLEPGEAVTVLVPLAQVLAALHADGVAVGGVGEQDVLLTEDGRPLLGDVGLDTLQAAATGAAPSSPDAADDVRGLAALAERLLLSRSAVAPPDPERDSAGAAE